VTRAEDEAGTANGEAYVYWFDDTGKYWQTNMQYLVTTDPARRGQVGTPTASTGTGQ
jgi:hypothetical protein